MRPPSLPRQPAFTLVELLVTTAILSLLIVLIAQLFSAATAVATYGEKRMGADAQARALLDRISLDLNALIARQDVSFFLKDDTNQQSGNDQLAFFAQTVGYYPSSGSTSPISVIAYRVSPTPAIHVERMAKGLLWNGQSDPAPPLVYLPLTLAGTWPTATNSAPDTDYETVGPDVFRFEYGYLLAGDPELDDSSGTSVPKYPAVYSDIPWDARQPGHTSVNGLRDVAGISITIAAIDPKSRLIVTETQLAALAAAMDDLGQTAGDALETNWNKAVINSSLPQAAKSSIRIYTRLIPLSHSHK